MPIHLIIIWGHCPSGTSGRETPLHPLIIISPPQDKGEQIERHRAHVDTAGGKGAMA